MHGFFSFRILFRKKKQKNCKILNEHSYARKQVPRTINFICTQKKPEIYFFSFKNYSFLNYLIYLINDLIMRNFQQVIIQRSERLPKRETKIGINTRADNTCRLPERKS